MATNTTPRKKNEKPIIKSLVNIQVNNMNYPPEYYNDLIAEERGYKKWEQEQKNRILRMTNPKRKQEEWNKLFPIMQLDNDYLNSKELVF